MFYVRLLFKRKQQQQVLYVNIAVYTYYYNLYIPIMSQTRSEVLLGFVK